MEGRRWYRHMDKVGVGGTDTWTRWAWLAQTHGQGGRGWHRHMDKAGKVHMVNCNQ